MKGYWSDTRPNGKPVEAGTFCWITDMEDGSGLIATYGKSTEEVLEKVTAQNVNAQLALQRRATAPQQPQPTAPAAAPRRTLSADEVMQATQDLGIPGKAGPALVKLIADETGVDPRQAAIDSFARLGMEWEREHPEFYPHPGNRQLLGESVGRKVGGKVGLITKAMLTETFEELYRRGLLFEEPAQPQQQMPQPVLPGESQVQPLERPRGTRFATGARSTSFRAPQTVQRRGLKYTEEQIRTMPMSESVRLIETNDPDYAAACEYYFPQQQQASA